MKIDCPFLGIHVIMGTSSFNSGSSSSARLQVLAESLTHLLSNCQFYFVLNLHFLSIIILNYYLFMYPNGVFGSITAVLTNSFISQLFTIDFSYHDFASYLILSVIGGTLAHFLTISLLVFLLKFSANRNSFIWICSHL